MSLDETWGSRGEDSPWRELDEPGRDPCGSCNRLLDDVDSEASDNTLDNSSLDTSGSVRVCPTSRAFWRDDITISGKSSSSSSSSASASASPSSSSSFPFSSFTLSSPTGSCLGSTSMSTTSSLAAKDTEEADAMEGRVGRESDLVGEALRVTPK